MPALILDEGLQLKIASRSEPGSGESSEKIQPDNAELNISKEKRAASRPE